MRYFNLWAEQLVQALGWMNESGEGPSLFWITFFTVFLSAVGAVVIWRLLLKFFSLAFVKFESKQVALSRFHWPVLAWWLLENAFLIAFLGKLPGMNELYRLALTAFFAGSVWYFISSFLADTNIERRLGIHALRVIWILFCLSWVVEVLHISLVWLTNLTLPGVLGLAYIGKDFGRDFFAGFLLRRKLKPGQQIQIKNDDGKLDIIETIIGVELFSSNFQSPQGSILTIANFELWKRLISYQGR